MTDGVTCASDHMITKISSLLELKAVYLTYKIECRNIFFLKENDILSRDTHLFNFILHIRILNTW